MWLGGYGLLGSLSECLCSVLFDLNCLLGLLLGLLVGCMRCFQLSENYVVFYVCHKSTSVFVSSVGSYCHVVFEVRCSMSGF